MNPLSEWPDDILRQCLFTQDEDSPRYYWDEKEPVYAPEALAELLRRERERCAKELDAAEAECRRGSEAMSALGLEPALTVPLLIDAVKIKKLAKRIRGLQ